MKRLIPLIASLALFAVPATAAAATSQGVVLSANSKAHRLQLVDSRHVVRAYQYRASLPLRLGSRVSFRAAGATITKLTSRGARAHRLSFLATVVHSTSAATVLRLGDGDKMSVGTHRAVVRHPMTAHPRRDQTPIAFAAATRPGFEPGLVVLVTETLGKAGISISIKPAPASSAGVGGERQLTGVVTAVGSRSLTIRTPDETVSFQMSAKLASAGLQTCDEVLVKYHQHGAALIADKVTERGTSSTGSCSGQAGSGGSGGSGGNSGDDGPDVIGNITTISGSGLTINVPGQESMSFVVDDPTITEGFVAGDQVDVTFSEDSNGTLDASNVEYVENDAVGAVLAVSDSSLTINDPSGVPNGPNQTFTDNSGDDMFDGISVHDTVDVSYHLSSGQPVVDGVYDETNGN